MGKKLEDLDAGQNALSVGVKKNSNDVEDLRKALMAIQVTNTMLVKEKEDRDRRRKEVRDKRKIVECC